jgi:hypothetical protein
VSKGHNQINIECGTIESIFTEINFKNRKWLICGLYRPPSLSDHLFMKDFNKTFDKISVKYDNVITELNLFLILVHNLSVEMKLNYEHH